VSVWSWAWRLLQCFSLFEVLVVIDKVVTTLAPCSSVYAGIFAGERRIGEAEGPGERADGVVVIGRRFGEGINEGIGLWWGKSGRFLRGCWSCWFRRWRIWGDFGGGRTAGGGRVATW